MCKWCDEALEPNGMITACQFCSTQVCQESDSSIDVIRGLYVTAAGDVACLACGPRQDSYEEQEREYLRAEDDYGWMPGPWDW